MGRKRKHNSPTTKGETMAKKIEQPQAPGAVMDTQTEVAVMQQEPENKIKIEVRTARARALPENKGLLFDLTMKVFGETKNEYDARSMIREELINLDEMKTFKQLKEACERFITKHDVARQKEADIEAQIQAIQPDGDEDIDSKISELVAAKVAIGSQARMAWDEFTATRDALTKLRDQLIKKAATVADVTKSRVVKDLKSEADALQEELAQLAGDVLLKLARCNHAMYRGSVGTIDPKMILQSLGVPTDQNQPLFCTRGTGGVQPPPSNGGVGGIIGTTMVYRV